jgi:hypothetical protein
MGREILSRHHFWHCYRCLFATMVFANVHADIGVTLFLVVDHIRLLLSIGGQIYIQAGKLEWGARECI